MHRIALFVALAAGASNVAHAAMSFFPKAPGQRDRVYLLYEDWCKTAPPIGLPTLTRLEGFGRWRFDIKHLDQEYVCDLPSSGGNTYAFEIPQQVYGADVGVIEVVEQLVHPHNGAVQTVAQKLARPRGRDFPPSVSGTWTIDGAASQGLLITMNPSEQIAVGFNTFDVAGKPAWFTGLGTVVQSGTAVPLMEVPGGSFAATVPNPVAARPWGELDLQFDTCGRLSGAVRPQAATGLPSRNLTFRQLTEAYEYECNLEALAARRQSKIVKGVYAIIE